MNKEVEKTEAVEPQASGKGATAAKKKGSLISILSIVFGIIIGVIVAWLQFQFEYSDNPSKYYAQLHNYIWVNVAALVVPWFMVFALGTPMAAFTYVAFKRMLRL